MILDENIRFQEFLTRHRQIKDIDAYFALRDALIDHVWNEYTDSDK